MADQPLAQLAPTTPTTPTTPIVPLNATLAGAAEVLQSNPVFLNTTLYRTYARETVNMYNTRALVVRTRQYYVLYVFDFISYYILLCIGLPCCEREPP